MRKDYIRIAADQIRGLAPYLTERGASSAPLSRRAAAARRYKKKRRALAGKYLSQGRLVVSSSVSSSADWAMPNAMLEPARRAGSLNDQRRPQLAAPVLLHHVVALLLAK